MINMKIIKIIHNCNRESYKSKKQKNDQSIKKIMNMLEFREEL